jgi:formate/nitrite transporter
MEESIKIKEHLSNSEMCEHMEELALKKVNYPWWKSFILSILGGVFIAFGGMFATIVSAGGGTSPYGIIRMISGLAFSLGLILVIVGGAELFTGSTIVSVAVFNKKIKITKLFKNWLTVYFGNFCGAILVATLIFLSKHYTFGNGSIGITALNTSLLKIHHTFVEAMVLGILCNLLVCLAIWLTYSTKSISGKIMAIIFPVTAFVAAGFEHSVANMYFVPLALFIKELDVKFALNTGLNLGDLSWGNFLMNNLLPVTIGNIIGGVLLWLTFNILYRKNKVNESSLN